MSEESVPATHEASKGPAPARGGGLRRAAMILGGVLVAWIGLSIAVLFWQPGRFAQIGVGGVAVVLALALPGKLVHRFGWLGVALVLFVGVFYVPSWALSSEVEFTVRNTTRDAVRDVYLVHTDYGAKAKDDPGETFRNTDSPLFWKVNASDWEGVLDGLKGQRVRARVIGIRFADRSLYRNIISVEAL